MNSSRSRHQTPAMHLRMEQGVATLLALPSAVKAPCLVVENMKFVPARIWSPFTNPVWDRALPAFSLAGSGNGAAANKALWVLSAQTQSKASQRANVDISKTLTETARHHARDETIQESFKQAARQVPPDCTITTRVLI